MFPGETVMSGAVKDEHVSEFQVLQSGGGWYIGTIYTYCEFPSCSRCKGELPAGVQEPYSRETDYFDTELEAEAALALFQVEGELPRMRT